jgi:photosystem II stability/assembly factor-like uncharacterized protein
MKTKLFTLITILVFSTSGYSQISWYSQNSGTNRELTDVCFVDDNNGWISGWTETMLHTTDGGQTWTSQTVPPNNAYYSVFFTDSQNGWASGYAGKIIHTTDGGQNWSSQSPPTNYDLYDLYFINADTGWAAGGDFASFPSGIDDRIILNTTNGGNTWTIQHGEAYKQPLKSIYFIDQNSGYATGPGGVIMHTTDGGINWAEQQVLSSFSFNDVFFSDPNTGFVVGDYLGLPHHSVIYKTTDGGSNWIETQLGTDEIIDGIYFTDEMNGWAAGNNYGSGNIGVVYHTTDGGENWIVQSTPAIDALFSIYFTDANHGWATGHLGTVIATESPVPVEITSFTATADGNDVRLNWQTATETNNKGFEIERKGREWKTIGYLAGHGSTTQERHYSYNDNNIEAGNYSYRLIQIDLNGTQTESEIVSVTVKNPAEYVLNQNYPNPFNPTTNISYSIPKDGQVKLTIYNALGEKVKTLADGYKNAGRYNIEFNANNLSSGIYYYRIESGTFVKIRKMILLR